MGRLTLILVAVLFGVGAHAQKAPREPDGYRPLYKVISKKPETNEPYLRAWWAHRDAHKGVAYVVIPKKVPMHVHLDADHVVTVIEGFAMVTLGGAKAWMSPGDTLAIPRGMAHEIQRVGVKRLLMMDISTPAGDMAKTFWIEEPHLGAPGAVAAAKPRPAAPSRPTMAKPAAPKKVTPPALPKPPVKNRAQAPGATPGAR